ncbi:MAG TPA: nucleotidyltransferase family protein [Leptolyngbya sp.]|jgi:predicted nucleotidyltransferase|nr:nucleotidyltransferase family protein [Leptolyngbya sp.]
MMERTFPISIPQDQLTDFCQRHHIQRLSLFGSVLRDDFTDESDVDVLVEFEPGNSPGYLRFAGMENELSDLIGRTVDLRTPDELSRYFRQEVLRSAVVQYVQNR